MSKVFLHIIFVVIFTSQLFAIDGIIDGQTWGKAGSPYHITGDITIIDLTIQPGVEIIFDQDYLFTITGILNARGIESDSIYFYPATGNDFPGITFTNTAAYTELDYISLRGATSFGFRFQNDSIYISNSHIKDVLIDGIEINGSNAVIERCIISGNGNKGVKITGAGEGLILNSIITGNGNRGISLEGGTLNLYNCLVSYNIEYGIYLNSASDILNFYNCSIVEHDSGPGIGNNNGTVNGLNSIIYGNSPAVVVAGGSTTISYSDIEGDYDQQGIENIHEDPLFDNYLLFTLSENSPCIDAGNPATEFNDICFPPSMGRNRNDMGAYGGPAACYWYSQLYVMPEILDFGNVTIDYPDTQYVMIKNYRHFDLEILNTGILGVDSIFFTAPEISTLLAPFDSIKVEIIFTPDLTRSYQASLLIESSDGYMEIDLTGKGVVPDIGRDPAILFFNDVKVGQSSLLKLDITNTFGAGDLYIDSITVSDRAYSVSQTDYPFKIERNSKDSVFVSFAPDTIGLFQDTLFIFSNDPNDSLITVQLRGTGEAPFLLPLPEMIEFGSVRTDEDSLTTMQLQNTGTDTLHISSVELSGDITGSFILLTAPSDTTIAPGDFSNFIHLLFAPSDTGIVNAFIEIYSNHPFPQGEPVQVPLQGYGIKPIIELSEHDFAFGEVIVDSDSQKTILIKNSGNGPLAIDSVRFYSENDNFSLNFVSVIIAPGQSDSTLKLVYSPSSEGADSVRLNIFSDDPDQQVIDTLITGTGVLPVLTTQPQDTLHFGEIDLTTADTMDLLLHNSGSGLLHIDTISLAGPDISVFMLIGQTSNITLAPNEATDTLRIQFIPDSPRTYEAEVVLLTNNPYTDTVRVILTGEGITPVINVYPITVDFDSVFISDTDTSDLKIKNTGKGSLIVYDLSISGVDSLHFGFSGISPGDSIPGMDSLNMKLFFNPLADSTGLKSAQLLITNSDTENPLVSVSIKGVSLNPVQISVTPAKLYFDSVYVNLDSSASLNIANTGQRNLEIDSLYFTGTGQANFKYEQIGSGLVIPSGENRNLNITFSPREGGTISDTIFIHNNDPLHEILQVPLAGFGITDTSQVFFTIDAAFDTVDYQSQNHAFSVEINKDGPGVSHAELNIRTGGKGQFDILSLINTNGNNWSINLPSQYISERSIEYYVHAAYPGGNACSPDSGWIHPAQSIVTNISLEFPDQTARETYQMISLPLDPASQTLADLFGDNLGSYDNTKFRFFDWSFSNSEYLELNQMNVPLYPGKALWLITAENKTLDVSGCRSVSTLSEYEVPLTQGWNMIATPFPFAIDIASINTSLLQYDIFYHFQNGTWQGNSDSTFSTILPYHGYAVKAAQAGILRIPNVEAGQTMTKQKSGKGSETGWKIQLIVTRGKMQDIFNYAGVHHNAQNGPDRNDFPEPPVIGEYVQLFFNNNNEYLTGDFRAPGEPGYEFDMTVRSNFKGEISIVLLSQNLPENYTWQIISPASGVKYTENQIQTALTEQNYKLLVGNAEYVERMTAEYKLVPHVFELNQNYPNPFNPETRIKFALPQPTFISVIIYDITGRKIKTMVRNEYREQGYYQFLWDGKNDSGMNVASGMYLLYLKTPEYHKAIKMILQR